MRNITFHLSKLDGFYKLTDTLKSREELGVIRREKLFSWITSSQIKRLNKLNQGEKIMLRVNSDILNFVEVER